jgi:hypothetical protein
MQRSAKQKRSLAESASSIAKVFFIRKLYLGGIGELWKENSGQSSHSVLLLERMRDTMEESIKKDVFEVDKIYERGVFEPVGVFTIKDQ